MVDFCARELDFPELNADRVKSLLRLTVSNMLADGTLTRHHAHQQGLLLAAEQNLGHIRGMLERMRVLGGAGMPNESLLQLLDSNDGWGLATDLLAWFPTPPETVRHMAAAAVQLHTRENGDGALATLARLRRSLAVVGTRASHVDLEPEAPGFSFNMRPISTWGDAAQRAISMACLVDLATGQNRPSQLLCSVDSIPARSCRLGRRITGLDVLKETRATMLADLDATWPPKLTSRPATRLLPVGGCLSVCIHTDDKLKKTPCLRFVPECSTMEEVFLSVSAASILWVACPVLIVACAGSGLHGRVTLQLSSGSSSTDIDFVKSILCHVPLAFEATSLEDRLAVAWASLHTLVASAILAVPPSQSEACPLQPYVVRLALHATGWVLGSGTPRLCSESEVYGKILLELRKCWPSIVWPAEYQQPDEDVVGVFTAFASAAHSFLSLSPAAVHLFTWCPGGLEATTHFVFKRRVPSNGLILRDLCVSGEKVLCLSASEHTPGCPMGLAPIVLRFELVGLCNSDDVVSSFLGSATDLAARAQRARSPLTPPEVGGIDAGPLNEEHQTCTDDVFSFLQHFALQRRPSLLQLLMLAVGGSQCNFLVLHAPMLLAVNREPAAYVDSVLTYDGYADGRCMASDGSTKIVVDGEPDGGTSFSEDSLMRELQASLPVWGCTGMCNDEWGHMGMCGVLKAGGLYVEAQYSNMTCDGL